ncbi:hypothetical protein K466DRAFT_182352 [Polyporus arcularius HHB13444]|uniref:Uncharacterized protein n=1 Tax=Polyporus arcularius HHB13444 TaxID=1314778 RepID=A0A5C3PTF8_9APHY|nr:hypothetical protein K466DRAFT_182352 [Polyporus arcularius HHB13444]
MPCSPGRLIASRTLLFRSAGLVPYLALLVGGSCPIGSAGHVEYYAPLVGGSRPVPCSPGRPSAGHFSVLSWSAAGQLELALFVAGSPVTRCRKVETMHSDSWETLRYQVATNTRTITPQGVLQPRRALSLL